MRLPDIITHNFTIKLLSFLLACGIWFAIYAREKNIRFSQADGMDQAARVFSNHQVTVMRAASDARGFRVLPDSVEITVVGPPQAIQQLSARDVVAFINLTDASETGLTRRVQVSFPPQVRVTAVRPPDVRLELARP